jgi:hypothetical protein
MSISIHYAGRIKNITWIPELTKEVEHICKTMRWKATPIYMGEARVNGIVFAPRRSEMVCFTFTRTGRLISPHGLMDIHIPVSEVLSQEHSYMCHTKTSWAGPDVHMAVIELIRYVTGKYFEEFTLYDEAMFWETNDKKKLLERFGAYNAAPDTADDAISVFKSPRKGRESALVRLETILKEKLVGKSD